MGLGVKVTNAGGQSSDVAWIEITNMPTKTTYAEGEVLDLTGLEITATLKNQTTQVITDYSTSPANGAVLSAGTTTVTVYYKDAKTTFSIIVKVIESIAVTTPPTKTEYIVDEALDLTGMVVTATWSDQSTTAVTGYTTTPAEGTIFDAEGNITITVAYGGFTTSFTVSVITVEIVSWATGTDAQIAAMVEAHRNGSINLADYWAVGQERSVTLSGIETVTMVLMAKGGFTMTSGKTCAFVVGQKNALSTTRAMNSTNTNDGGWNSCAMRTYCNGTYYNAVPSALRPIFGQFRCKAGKGGGTTSGVQTSNDYFALPAEIEIFGSIEHSVSGEGTQMQYYKTTANRIKKRGNSGSAGIYWERSPRSGASSGFCFVLSDGTADGSIAGYSFGVAPFGCIG